MKFDLICMLLTIKMTYIGSDHRLPRYRRILEGKMTSVHDHPYMVAMLTDSKRVTNSNELHFRCSGSLITEKAILSVAHCFFTNDGEPISANEWKARIGSSFCYIGGALYDIELIYHKNYDNETRKNDVAVVETMERIQHIGGLVKPIAMADAKHEIVDLDSLTVIGWGKTAFHLEAPNNLHEVDMEVMANDLCNEVYEHLLGTPEAHEYFDLAPGEQVFRPISDGMMCAHGKGGKGVCMGDSGGAVVHKGVLVAMVALVPASCNSSLPAVFTRVSYYWSWIQTIIGSMNMSLPQPAPS